MKVFVLIAALPLAACAGAPVVVASASSCVDLIPPSWEKGVEGAPLPEDDTVGSWIVFGDAQTGKLEQANGHTKDVMHICRKVEENDARAIKRASRGWLGRLFGT